MTSSTQWPKLNITIQKLFLDCYFTLTFLSFWENCLRLLAKCLSQNCCCWIISTSWSFLNMDTSLPSGERRRDGRSHNSQLSPWMHHYRDNHFSKRWWNCCWSEPDSLSWHLDHLWLMILVLTPLSIGSKPGRTSDSPVDSHCCWQVYSAPSLLNPAAGSYIWPALWGERDWTSELRPANHNWALTTCSISIWIQTKWWRVKYTV